MRLTRRVLLTAAFVALSGLLVFAADKYYDLLFLFYPSVCREIQGYLAAWSAGFDFVIWQRALLILAILVVVTLIICILRKKNVLGWLFGWTTAASVALFLYMLLWGINLYSPSIAVDLRMEVADSYSSTQLQEAAQYYLESANALASRVDRDETGLCKTESFADTAAKVGSGFQNMTRTCYVFGGSTEAPKELGWSNVLKTSGVTVPFTGEVNVNPDLLPVTMPFVMSRQVALRMSIAPEEDASFAAILACMASDDITYQYSGYYMAYVYLYHALDNTNSAKTAHITQNLNKDLQADLIANGTLEGESARGYMTISGDERDSIADNTVADLLVAWYIKQTTPVEEAEEESTHGAEVVPAPEEAMNQNALAQAAENETAASGDEPTE